MSFLAPLFLAGAFAVALPVVFHLIRRTTRRRTVFSSLMFLKSTPPRLTRRNRLEHVLLLLLRCAAIGLLATGFARPFIKRAIPESSAGEPPKRMVILLDASASMRRGKLWSEACSRAEGTLKKASPADQVALFTFDRQLTPLVTFDEWQATAPTDRIALARSRLAQAKPGWSATRLGEAMIRASEMLSEQEAGDTIGRRQIVLISDFQEGSKLGALQGQEWPKGVELVSERVVTRTGNTGLQLLADANELPMSSSGVRVRVSNQPGSRREQFKVGWTRSDGQLVGKVADAYVPAGQSRIVTLALPDENVGADRVMLRGDDEAFDNTVFSPPPERSRLGVIYIGESETDSRGPLYFVRRALQGTPRQEIRITAKQPSAPLLPNEADAATMFIVTTAVPEELAAPLRSQLSQGKAVLFAPTDAAAAATLGNLLGQSSVPVEEGAPRSYAMLGEIDFRHPLFAPFADARYSDFTKIHFWKYRRLDLRALPGAQIVASFDNGDAAIADVPVGKGRVVFFASGWQPADSQLALSSKFVPLLCSMLEWNGGSAAKGAHFLIGDTIPLPAFWLQRDAAAAVTLPDGTSVKLARGATNFAHTSMPGIYHLKSGPAERRFAVNLDAAESRTAPLPPDELERLGVPTAAAPTDSARVAQQRIVLQSAELENRQKLWRWFIVVTLGVLCVESAVAGWMARRRAPQGGTVA